MGIAVLNPSYRATVLKADPASFVDSSIVKAIEDEGFVKRLGK